MLMPMLQFQASGSTKNAVMPNLIFQASTGPKDAYMPMFIFPASGSPKDAYMPMFIFPASGGTKHAAGLNPKINVQILFMLEGDVAYSQTLAPRSAKDCIRLH